MLLSELHDKEFNLSHLQSNQKHIFRRILR